MENTNLDAVSCDYCEYGDINGEIRCSLRDIALELEVSGQFHYTKRNGFMPFLLAEIQSYQGSAHLIGVGSFE